MADNPSVDSRPLYIGSGAGRGKSKASKNRLKKKAKKRALQEGPNIAANVPIQSKKAKKKARKAKAVEIVEEDKPKLREEET